MSGKHHFSNLQYRERVSLISLKVPYIDHHNILIIWPNFGLPNCLKEKKKEEEEDCK